LFQPHAAFFNMVGGLTAAENRAVILGNFELAEAQQEEMLRIIAKQSSRPSAMSTTHYPPSSKPQSS
jgi:hypothetical protein